MRSPTVLLCFLVVAAVFLRAQVRTDSSKSWELLGDKKPEVTNALVEGGSLVGSATEFSFVPRRREHQTSSVDSQTPSAWTFGNHPLTLRESHLVEIQVGEYHGKPVFLPLRVPRETSDGDMKDSIRLLTEAIADNPKILGQFSVQSCTRGKKCVKICKDDKDKPFCCRYICASTLE